LFGHINLPPFTGKYQRGFENLIPNFLGSCT
jgi:hypothetical protein